MNRFKRNSKPRLSLKLNRLTKVPRLIGSPIPLSSITIGTSPSAHDQRSTTPSGRPQDENLCGLSTNISQAISENTTSPLEVCNEKQTQDCVGDNSPADNNGNGRGLFNSGCGLSIPGRDCNTEVLNRLSTNHRDSVLSDSDKIIKKKSIGKNTRLALRKRGKCSSEKGKDQLENDTETVKGTTLPDRTELVKNEKKALRNKTYRIKVRKPCNDSASENTSSTNQHSEGLSTPLNCDRLSDSTTLALQGNNDNGAVLDGNHDSQVAIGDGNQKGVVSCQAKTPKTPSNVLVQLRTKRKIIVLKRKRNNSGISSPSEDFKSSQLAKHKKSRLQHTE